MRADRLLSEILLLQARGRLSGREMAKRLEVSERTVHRDMEALSAAGVPVMALRGARGGWQLDEHWRTQVPGLDEAELRALLMAQPRLLGETRLASAAERALGKLVAALPDPLREKAASIRQRLHVDTTAWRGATEDLSMLPLVQDAVAHDRRLLILYRKPGEKKEERRPRRVDPLGLVAKGSTWYLVANTPGGLRTFRVSRIASAKLLEQPAQRPASFDLAAYWASSTAKFQEGWRRFEAVLRVEPRAAEWIETWHIAKHEGQSSPTAVEGWRTMRVQFDHEKEALFMLLGLGARVEVVEPASLREQLAAEVTEMAKLHKKWDL
jgi:predicted DNA-binding transcriptional regulator YafY